MHRPIVDDLRANRSFLVTILAFIYVPLTTVTSVYGMNIQQINGSGHNIWVFLVTAVLALLVTGLSWLVIIIASRRGLVVSAASLRVFEPGIRSRCYLLIWLICKGHTA